MILVEVRRGSIDSARFTAFVELEVGAPCCHCDEEIAPGAVAVFHQEVGVPARIAHLRSVCARPPSRRVEDE